MLWGYVEVDSRSKPKSVPCLILYREVNELSQIPFDSICLKLVACCPAFFLDSSPNCQETSQASPGLPFTLLTGSQNTLKVLNHHSVSWSNNPATNVYSLIGSSLVSTLVVPF